MGPDVSAVFATLAHMNSRLRGSDDEPQNSRPVAGKFNVDTT